MAQSKKKEQENNGRHENSHLQPIRRSPTKQRSRVPKETSTKQRFYRLSYRVTDLSKYNPKMWWEQISEFIDLFYQKKLEELIELGTYSMDPHTTYHIKGDVICALGLKANMK